MKYRVGNLTVDTSLYRLSCNDKPIEVEPRVFNLLVYLIENSDRVVTRSELLETLWKGRVVSDSALSACLKVARKTIGDTGSEQNIIKTIHGRGYQFIAEVSVSDMENDESNPEPSRDQEDLPLPDKSSIAVLPFENLSGDIDQEYFSDGITEDIITELSRFRELFVIGRNSSFVFKGKPHDVVDVGRQLGVQYVIEGSVRRGGNRVRVTARLVDATTGRDIWAERYDRELGDIFLVQDEIVRSAVGAVFGHLRHAELTRAGRIPPSDLRTHELALQAYGMIYELEKENVARAVALFEKALAIEPDYAFALAGLGISRYVQCAWRWTSNPEELRQLGLKELRQAVKIDDALHTAHWLLSEIHLYGFKNLDEAKVHAERAIKLNPSASDIVSWLGFVRCVEARFEEGIPLIKEALRLDPLAPGFVRELMGAAYFLAEDYESAVMALRASNLYSPDPLMYLIAAYQGAGRTEEAKETSTALMELGMKDMESPPDNWIEHLAQESGFVRNADLERYKSLLRKAGVPDGPFVL